MGPRLRNWIDAMLSSDSGRISLRNLAIDIEKDRIDPGLLRMFFDFVETTWPASPPRSSPEKLIKQFAQTSDPPKRLCQGRPSTKDTTNCSRIMEANTLWEQHIDPEAGAPLEHDVTDAEIERAAIYGPGPAARGVMRTSMPFAWVTKTCEINSLRERYEATATRPDRRFATAVRDGLGLLSFVRPVQLVEVVYPPDAVTNVAVAPPTFIEGRDIVFQSHDDDNGWGRTVSLNEKHQPLPEAVHEPIPFSPEFSIRAVGRPGETTLSIVWDAFAFAPDNLEDLIAWIDRILEKLDDR